MFPRTLFRCSSEWVATQGCLRLMVEIGMPSIFGGPCMLFEEGSDFKAWHTQMLLVLRQKGWHMPLDGYVGRPLSLTDKQWQNLDQLAHYII